MHHVRVASRSSSARSTSTRPELADAPEVVAAEVDEHHVLGALLLVGEQLLGDAQVLLRGLGRAGACRRSAASRRGRRSPSPAAPARRPRSRSRRTRGSTCRATGSRPAGRGRARTARPGTGRTSGATARPGRCRPRRCTPWPARPPPRTRRASCSTRTRPAGPAGPARPGSARGTGAASSSRARSISADGALVGALDLAGLVDERVHHDRDLVAAGGRTRPARRRPSAPCRACRRRPGSAPAAARRCATRS